MRVRWGVAALLAVVAAAILVTAQAGQGVARDEVVYMRAGSHYADWWIALASGEDGTVSERAITAHFGGPGATDNNREHPPLMKTLFGLSERLLHDRLGWTSEIVGYRFPSALFGGLLVALVFLFASGLWGTATGLVAAALVFLLPRGFFHFQLAAFDGAVVTLWFATLYAYHRALGSRWGFIGFGVVYGLLLATKHNALLLPVGLAAHWAWLLWRHEAASGSRGRRLLEKVRAARPQVWLGVVVIGPLVLIALWPWLWFDTGAHLRDWIGFHVRHVHYNFEYLGTNHNAPPFPWHVPIVTTLLTVPVVTLVGAAMGGTVLVERWRQGRFADPLRRAPVLLLLLSAGVAIGPFLLGSTPIFGAEKHWAPAIPSLCLYAGVGVVAIARAAVRQLAETWAWARRGWAPVVVTSGLAALVVGASAAETVDAHPYALSHYNALAGGAPGGADLGMNRQFWGYSARGILPAVNRFAPAKGEPPVPVYTHDASPAWALYRRAGLLAPGLPDAGHEDRGVRRSELALVIHERHFRRHDYMIWNDYGTVQPAFVLTADGVPIVSLYVRPGAAPEP